MVRSILVFAAVLGCAVPAAAEPQPIEVAPDKEWVHAPTGLRFPVRIGDTVRDRIVSYLAGDNNVGSTYFSAGDDEILSIYVYRSGSYDVSMMADAAIGAISSNEMLGSIDRDAGDFSTFGDAMIGEGSGVLDTFAVDGAYRSTGVALFRSGNWLIKLRLSSKTSDADTLEKRLTMLAAGLPLDPPVQKAPPAYRVPACANVFPRPAAVPRNLDMTDLIIATSAVSLSYDQEASGTPATLSEEDTARLCRDGRSRPGRMLYRDGETGNPVAIVYGDSGTVAHVGPMSISLQEGQSPAVIVSLGNGMRTQFYQGFETIPGFDQIFELLDKDQVVAAVERTGEGSTITLSMPE